MAGDVPQAADPQNISLRGNGAGEGNKVWGFMENSTRPRHWAQCSTAVAPAHMAPTARLPARPRLSVTVGSDGRKGTRGPSEARTARTVDVPNWPFTVQPLVRFHVLSLVDEPAEATSTTPPPRPGSRTHNKSPLPTRGHTHAASTQVSQAVRAAGPSAVGPSSQRRSAPRMEAESVSRPRRHLIPI